MIIDYVEASCIKFQSPTFQRFLSSHQDNLRIVHKPAPFLYGYAFTLFFCIRNWLQETEGSDEKKIKNLQGWISG